MDTNQHKLIPAQKSAKDAKDFHLTRIFAALKPALQAADSEWQRTEPTESPNFGAVSLVNPDENQLSDVLADMLDPKGSHGQGARFLELFLSRLRCSKQPEGRQVTVHRESATVFLAELKQRRRIDILVDGGEWGIGIENKPWAGEQTEQLQDYAKDLEKRFTGNFMLVRFAGRDVDPKSLSATDQMRLSSENKFVTWQYDADVQAWIQHCARECRAPRVTIFLDELNRFITREFGKPPNARTIMDQKYLLPVLESIVSSDAEQLRALAAITEFFPVLRQKFVAQLFDEVQKDVLAALKSGWSANRSTENFVDTDWAIFEFAHSDWNGLYSVRLESQPRFGLVVLGIWHDRERGITRSKQLVQDLKRLEWGKKGGGPSWEAHSPLREPFTNWASPTGISAVVKQRAELKDLLTGAFTRLCTQFKSPLANLAKSVGEKSSFNSKRP